MVVVGRVFFFNFLFFSFLLYFKKEKKKSNYNYESIYFTVDGAAQEISTGGRNVQHTEIAS